MEEHQGEQELHAQIESVLVDHFVSSLLSRGTKHVKWNMPYSIIDGD